MLRVYTDFNEMTRSGEVWILKYFWKDLSEIMINLGVNYGDGIKLYQDEGDFEVDAVLEYRFVDFLKRKSLVAIPDWSTMREIGKSQR